jgi:hypothetical protein
MKTNLFLLLALLILAATACQEPIDVKKEKEAIIAVVNAESNAYIARDLETLSSYMVRDSLNIQIMANKWNYAYTKGWERLNEGYVKDFADEEKWGDIKNLKLERENFNIKIYPKSAWAVFNTVYSWDRDSVNTKWKVLETRFLEKVGEEWKITYVSNVAISSYEVEEETEMEDTEQEEVAGEE